MNNIQHAMNPATSSGQTRRCARPSLARRVVLTLGALALCASLAACSEKKVPVEVVGYNHMSDWFISGFSVNGASGPNVSPEGGGGGFMCCAAIPEHWRPGMKARVTWGYDTRQGGPQPPPSQEAEVDIPEYTPKNLGNVQVHFYPGHRVKVVVSKYGLGHPLYPLPREDWAPWGIDEIWERNYNEDKAKGIEQ